MRIPLTNIEVNFGSKIEQNSATPRPISFNTLFKDSPLTGGSEFKISTNSLFTVFRQNSDIRNCVREIQYNTGKSGTKFVNVSNPDAQITERAKTELYSVFNSQESTHKTFKSLLRRTVRDIEVAGNAYWVKLRNDGGALLGFQPADPRTMAIIADRTGVVLKYIQRVAGQDPIEYSPEDIVHFKGDDDTLSEVFGMGKLEPIIWEARTDNAAMISNYKFFDNNAVPSALYILDPNIPAEKLKSKFSEIKKHFGGAQNYKKAGAVVGVKDIKMLNMSQKDMDFLAGRAFSTKKICASFGVPEFLLGYTEAVNNNNGVELEKNFMEKTIIPIEQNIESTINMQVMPELESGSIAFMFNEHIFSNAKELEERAEKLYKAGMITLRQAKRMMGQEITPEDEKQENIDEYIIHNGASAVLLEDVGIDPEISADEE